jgi:hypothetical protein
MYRGQSATDDQPEKRARQVLALVPEAEMKSKPLNPRLNNKYRFSISLIGTISF